MRDSRPAFSEARKKEIKTVVRDLLLVEAGAIAMIAFAYFVWPYPPLAWQPNYALFTGVNYITVSMAAIAWVGVGYILYETVAWGARRFRRSSLESAPSDPEQGNDAVLP